VRVDQAPHQAGDVGRLQAQRQPADLGRGQREQVADEPLQARQLALDRLQVGVQRCCAVAAVVAEGALNVAADGGDGRA
jgi:hypothetical protein